MLYTIVNEKELSEKDWIPLLSQKHTYYCFATEFNYKFRSLVLPSVQFVQYLYSLQWTGRPPAWLAVCLCHVWRFEGDLWSSFRGTQSSVIWWWWGGVAVYRLGRSERSRQFCFSGLRNYFTMGSGAASPRASGRWRVQLVELMNSSLARTFI